MGRNHVNERPEVKAESPERSQNMTFRKLAAWWRAPYPGGISSWKAVVIPGLIVFLVLYLLEPFGISRIDSGKLWKTLGSAGIAMTVSAVFVCVLPRLFPKYYAEEDWTLGKEVLQELAMLLLLAVCICYYVAWISGTEPSGHLFLLALVWVLLLGAFPVILFAMWNRNIQLSRHLRDAVEMNRSLSEKTQASPMPASPAAVDLRLAFSGGTRESLEIAASAFLYAASEGNYVRLHYLSGPDGGATSSLLRLTLKQAEAVTAVCPHIVRCHRAFLVNVRHVSKVAGNSQGYRLRLDAVADEVPVSRAYAKAVRALIAASNA